ncbi:hypothetical protein JG688_00007470 [Phytophthora aleatoria]|uniref:Uncharacterized protein n=1 Tax=Phytophthora aleatoria TaxID=2496075 RepID=A0A8J5MGA9_9STRA|nr:hypothetical protein JG688_00007470 [Phytophthora aleatoria]
MSVCLVVSWSFSTTSHHSFVSGSGGLHVVSRRGMAHDEGEACVYVKQSVLRELEQERRRLKWQLSRALQTSDTHAAELEASKAKVKDLLTIVELNKGVADQAVQRSHGRDVQRRAELESLHQQNKQQRQRYVDFAVCLMSRRVRYRQQPTNSTSRSTAEAEHARSKETSTVESAQVEASVKVYPLQLSLPTFSTVKRTPCSVLTSAKVNDNSGLLRWQLLRKMWRNWERVVRWKRRLRRFLALALQRLVRSVFVAWRSRVRTLRQRRVSLRRILARSRQRLQQFGLTRFRLRCAEISAHEWAGVLRTAHTAMEEERKLRADVQSSVACELHTAYVREQQRQQRFTELQTQRLEALTRREFETENCDRSSVPETSALPASDAEALHVVEERSKSLKAHPEVDSNVGRSSNSLHQGYVLEIIQWDAASQTTAETPTPRIDFQTAKTLVDERLARSTGPICRPRAQGLSSRGNVAVLAAGGGNAGLFSRRDSTQ